MEVPMKELLKKDPNLIQELFDEISPFYDFMNDLMTFGSIRWTRKFAVHVSGVKNLKKGTILDLACGTGDFTFEILKATRHRPDCKVIGVDFSRKMLLRAKWKSSRVLDENDRQRVKWLRASAFELPFPTESISATFIGYGIRNMNPPQKALQEVLRVTKKGGIVVVLESSIPRRYLERFVNHFYFSKVVPKIAGIFGAGNAYQYLAESMDKFYPPELMTRVIEDSGWSNVKWWQLLRGSVAVHRAIKRQNDNP